MTAATRPDPAYQLTPHQAEILLLVAEGNSNKEIGKRVHLSEDTVKTHLRLTYRRLRARDRAHAVHIAHQGGLLAGEAHTVPSIVVRDDRGVNGFRRTTGEVSDGE